MRERITIFFQIMEENKISQDVLRFIFSYLYILCKEVYFKVFQYKGYQQYIID